MAFLSFSSNDTALLINGNLDELLDLMISSEKCSRKDLIPQMYESSHQLRMLWIYDDEKVFDNLKNFTVNYNDQWNKGHDIFSYLDVFKTPFELAKYMIDSYENSEETDISMLEDQLGVSKDEWLKICSTVYENDFMKRRFTEILNNRIKDTL